MSLLPVVMVTGADPLAGGAGGTPGAAGAPPGSSTPVSPHLPSPHGLPPSHPLVAAAREQEMMYRDLLSRPPYSTDPLLAHQVRSHSGCNIMSPVDGLVQERCNSRALALELRLSCTDPSI